MYAYPQAAEDGLLKAEFFWIPSLAGPTTMEANKSGGGLEWLFPFVDGHPPIGWEQAAAYLVMPVLLVASQFASQKIMQPQNVGHTGRGGTGAGGEAHAAAAGVFRCCWLF